MPLTITIATKITKVITIKIVFSSPLVGVAIKKIKMNNHSHYKCNSKELYPKIRIKNLCPILESRAFPKVCKVQKKIINFDLKVLINLLFNYYLL